ncbi:MAG: T9SS type A sorting domain-containing protein [Bacteroidia bacterium]|nr:T9SS type A sorting domain-containing protein [Bacteroidia bacterium]
MKNKLLKIITICLLAFINNINAQVKLWGMTQNGGTFGNGVIYNTDANGQNFQVIVNFSGTTGSYLGANPLGSLMKASNGKLYGLTRKGGTNDKGTIFSYDISNSTFTTLYNFNSTSTAPSEPMGGFTEINNVLYATTSIGGTGGSGTLFSYDLSTNTFSTLINFSGTSLPYYGSTPSGVTLLYASNGLLYGTTAFSGLNNSGTLFSFNPTNSAYSTLVNFNGTTSGGTPYGGVIELNNKLYGTTNFGGTNNFGTIFSVDMSTGTHSVLASFTGSVGLNIGAKAKNSLTYANGLLYGTAANTGPSGDYGVVFSFDPSTNTYSNVVNFNGTNGRNPYGNLLYASNGNLYGMTYSGGSSSSGTLFEYNLVTNTHSVLTNFNNTNGGNPAYTGLIEVDPNIGTTLNENRYNENFKISPNPANQSINIQGVNFNEGIQVKIISIDGKILKDEMTQQSVINISDLNTGMYFIELTDKEGKTGVTKLIKE